MESGTLRQRLVDALDVLESARPPSFREAFDFLAVYLANAPPARDDDLAARFRRVIRCIEVAEERGSPESNLSHDNRGA